MAQLHDTDLNAPVGRPVPSGAEECVGEEEPRDEYSDNSSSASEEETIDDTVREDMLRLEESFAEHGMKFRLVDRIGEGEPAPTRPFTLPL